MNVRNQYVSKIVIVCFFVVSAYIFYKIRALPPKDDSLYPANGKPAPGITLQDVKGDKNNLSDYAGKVIILNFFATWCHPCQEEVLELKRVYQKYSAKDLVVIAVAMDESEDRVKDFIEEKRIDYYVWIDHDNRAIENYHINSIPVTFLIDRKGYIRAHHIGMLFDVEAIFRKELKKCLDMKVQGEDIKWAIMALGGNTRADDAKEKLEKMVSGLAQQCICPCGCNMGLTECNCTKPGGGAEIKQYLRKLCKEKNFSDQQRLQILDWKYKCRKVKPTIKGVHKECTIPLSKQSL